MQNNSDVHVYVNGGLYSCTPGEHGHDSILCMMPETRGGRELDIEVVVAGRRSKEDAALESLTSAPTPSLTLSAPHIEQIIGWPAAGMPTRGNLTVTLKGETLA